MMMSRRVPSPMYMDCGRTPCSRTATRGGALENRLVLVVRDRCRQAGRAAGPASCQACRPPANEYGLDSPRRRNACAAISDRRAEAALEDDGLVLVDGAPPAG